MATSTPRPTDIFDLPSNLRIISLNCWGLKYISKHRHARLTEIGRQLAAATPAPDIVGLQECWTQEDYLAIRELTNDVLPHGKFYWSGIFGGGLAILSRWPIEESSMYRYPLNGRPAAFWRGDWYVGKGVASARIRVGGGAKDVVEVFCTHLHAPYEREPHDSYICHRTAQAWEMAKLMRHAVERGHMVVGLGDFNMVPGSLAHGIVEAHGCVRDVWRLVHPDSALGSAENRAEKDRDQPVPTARQCVDEHGTTCDSVFNTWRWSKPMRRALEKGQDSTIDSDTPDPRAKRLDYIFFASPAAHEWRVADVRVGMTMRHPTLRCSLSDHFSVETTLQRRQPTAAAAASSSSSIRPLDRAAYQLIQAMIARYDARERRQRRLQLAHFWAACGVSVACLVGVWWAPRRWVAFLLALLSTLNLAAGALDGLLGFLFVKSELRALKEFRFEIDAAAAAKSREPAVHDGETVGRVLRHAERDREDETR